MQVRMTRHSALSCDGCMCHEPDDTLRLPSGEGRAPSPVRTPAQCQKIKTASLPPRLQPIAPCSPSSESQRAFAA